MKFNNQLRDQIMQLQLRIQLILFRNDLATDEILNAVQTFVLGQAQIRIHGVAIPLWDQVKNET